MNEKFPYGYDLNAYIDKAFEQMKADFPWATRDMIAEHTYFGIEKMGDDYQYVRYYSYCSPDIHQIQKHEKGGYSVYVTAGNRSAGGSKTVFIPASYFKLSWEEFLDKYLDLATPGSFYVGRADLKRDPRIKEFLGFSK